MRCNMDATDGCLVREGNGGEESSMERHTSDCEIHFDVSKWVQLVCVAPSALKETRRARAIGEMGFHRGVRWSAHCVNLIELDTLRCVAAMAFLHAYVPLSVTEMWSRSGERCGARGGKRQW